MLRRVAGAVAAPLRRSLCTAVSRPPWALTYRMAPLGAPSPGARPSLDLHEPPCVSQLSVPAHLADGMDLAAVSIQAASCDGLLLLSKRNQLSICNPATRQYAPLPLRYAFIPLGMYRHRPTGEYIILYLKN